VAQLRWSALERPGTGTLVVPLSTTWYSRFAAKHPYKVRRFWHPSFSRPYALAISVLAELFHNAPSLAPAQEKHMNEINSLLYDMHGTAHVILIAALFVILLIVH
jgi:hypothetical protein